MLDKQTIRSIVGHIIEGTPLEGFVEATYYHLTSDKNHSHKDIYYNKLTVQVMKNGLKEYSNCVDIGCYKGRILKAMLKYSPYGTHLAFEPVPYLYQYLKRKFKNNHNVKLYNCALSNTHTTTKFYIAKNAPVLSGLRRQDFRQGLEYEEMLIETTTLDYILSANYSDFAIDFIKIDAEGAEYDILEGMINTIRRYKPIIIVEHGKASQCFGRTHDQFYELINSLDYNILPLEKWTSKSYNLSFSKEEFINSLLNTWYFIIYPRL